MSVDVARLRRVRYGVRAALVLGVAASVVANILHARPNPVSQVIAAWPPLALLLTVELISRIPVHHRSLAAVRVVATAAIAGIAAWVSYWHMVGVAARYGETGAAPYLLPMSVDGLVVVASVCLVELAGQLRAVPVMPPAPPATVAAVDAGEAQDFQPVIAVSPERVSAPPETEITIPARVRPPHATPEQREQACLAYLRSVAEGRPLTGAQLGGMFTSPARPDGFGERWGRARIEDAQRQQVRPVQSALLPVGAGASPG